MYFFLYERSAEHHAMFINRMSVDKFGSLRWGITMQQVTISRRFCGVVKLDFNWSSSFKSLTLKSQTLNGERSECCTWIRWNFPRTSQLKCSFDGTSQVCEIFCSSYEMAAISTECRRQPFVLELCFVIFFEKKILDYISFTGRARPKNNIRLTSICLRLQWVKQESKLLYSSKLNKFVNLPNMYCS